MEYIRSVPAKAVLLPIIFSAVNAEVYMFAIGVLTASVTTSAPAANGTMENAVVIKRENAGFYVMRQSYRKKNCCLPFKPHGITYETIVRNMRDIGVINSQKETYCKDIVLILSNNLSKPNRLTTKSSGICWMKSQSTVNPVCELHSLMERNWM